MLIDICLGILIFVLGAIFGMAVSVILVDIGLRDRKGKK